MTRCFPARSSKLSSTRFLNKIKEKLKHFWSKYEKESFFTPQMEKEYKSKLERFKADVNEIIRLQHPFGMFSKAYKKNCEETKEVSYGKQSKHNLALKRDSKQPKETLGKQSQNEEDLNDEDDLSNPYTQVLAENKEFYFEFATLAFDVVKYNMSLYEKMKKNFCEFCKVIMKRMKRNPRLFDSKIFS
mmetsp:Transcript_25241/g.29110  ORF Transcript_25241/g.29110 Transcript_25241/m.29110 type:complete len:188 (-) Transcript_25241:40-603(-)